MRVNFIKLGQLEVCSRFHECNSAMCVSACCTHSFMHAACYPSYLSLADSIVSKHGQFWLQKQKLWTKCEV